MKRVVWVIILCFSIGSLVYLARNTDFKKIAMDISQSKIYVQRDNKANFLPDWTAEKLLAEINTAREASGAGLLTKNSKLDQAAKARLSVILTDNDVEGKVTGLTREKALSNVGYDASFVGELVLTGFFKSNDPIVFWKGGKNYLDTLNNKSFREAGIAIKNSEDRVDIYVLLVTPRKVIKQTVTPKISWGGPELWTAINKRRVEMGVNPLKQMDFLCTIASIRLNQLLELGKLDGHSGFVPVLERSDLKEQTSKYNISEFLIMGYSTPEESVKAWENTMGHRVLLAGGEYVWGCVYAQNSYGVAIAAY